jgi:hypothetical protein
MTRVYAKNNAGLTRARSFERPSAAQTTALRTPKCQINSNLAAGLLWGTHYLVGPLLRNTRYLTRRQATTDS